MSRVGATDDLPAADAGPARQQAPRSPRAAARAGTRALAPPTPAPHVKVGVVYPQSGPNAALRHRPEARLGPLAAAEPGAARPVRRRRRPGRRGHHPADRHGRRPEAAADRQGRHRGRARRRRRRARRHPAHGRGPRSCCSSPGRAPRTSRRRRATPTSGAPRSATRSWRRRWARSWRSPTPATASTSWRRPTSRPRRPSRASRWPSSRRADGWRAPRGSRPVRHPRARSRCIQRAKPKATYLALDPADAAAFVKAYAQANLAATIPLYGSGPITEGAVLTEEGPAATGVQSTLHYSDQLTTPANTAFVTAYKAAYQDAPSCFSVQGYDTARVLDAGPRRRRQAARRRHALQPDGQGHQLRQPARPVEVRRAGARCRTSTCARCRTRAARWSTPSCSTSAWRASPTRDAPSIHRD